MSEPIDRRGFLAGIGAGAAALGLGACGGGLQGRRAHPRARLGQRLRVPARLAEAIRGPVLTRGSAGFDRFAPVYNERFDSVRPRAIAFVLDAADVAGAIRWARAHGVALRARSGGHSYAGYSTVQDGVVIDLRRLRSTALGAGVAIVGAGAQLIDVYAALAAAGRTIPAGSCPSVGVAGHALGGGMGLAGRALGLTADNLIAAEIVTAEGRVRRVDAATDPGLLWALRGGGGGNF